MMDHSEAQNPSAGVPEETLNLSVSEGPEQGGSTLESPEDLVETLEALAAEVASAAARTIDFLSTPNAWPSSPLPVQVLRTDSSALGKSIAFAAAAAAADAAAAAAESDESDLAVEDSTAEADADGV